MENVEVSGFTFKEENKSNISLNKDGTIQLERKIFKKFDSELATDLVKKLPNASNYFLALPLLLC